MKTIGSGAGQKSEAVIEPFSPTDEIAEEIAKLSQGIKKLKEGRLNRKALGLLLSRATGLGQQSCLQVIDAAEDLEVLYLKKKNEK